MRLEAVEVRAFRNLADGVHAVPPEGALLLGRNGQGKTNLLEAIAYPALFRSLRGAPDAELAAFGGPGFRVVVEADAPPPVQFEAAWHRAPRRKRVLVDGVPPARLADAVGRWLAVAFLPADVALAAGAASERRRFLDRMLSVAERPYLVSLIAYRAALAQRNAALRQGRPDVARAFDVTPGFVLLSQGVVGECYRRVAKPRGVPRDRMLHHSVFRFSTRLRTVSSRSHLSAPNGVDKC